jgi:hypothetical protein
MTQEYDYTTSKLSEIRGLSSKQEPNAPNLVFRYWVQTFDDEIE